MAAYSQYASQSTQAPPFSVRQYGTSQFEFLGTKTLCTAAAVVAASRFLHVKGDVKKCLNDDEQVQDILATGVVWHSRWLATRWCTGGSATGKKSIEEVDVMATTDEICALEGIGMSVTDVCYAGQVDAREFGVPLVQAVRNLFVESKKRLQAFVLTTKGLSTFLGKSPGCIVVFDSHRRSAHDGLAEEDPKKGKAVLIKFENADALAGYLRKMYGEKGSKTEFYTLQEVELAKDHTEKVVVEECAQEETLDLKVSRAVGELQSWLKSTMGSRVRAMELPNKAVVVPPAERSLAVTAIRK
eukprot:comp49407_c0_seq1/m.47626 comp49407_c0_seq1/g.47626  ORF comp49407_c0_seq1/g.47626 comp49407_c0_seq1/m.47626 type:complete len:300 (-) comp49407_c0_seq1:360-1259(-)